MREEVIRIDNAYKSVDGAAALDAFCMNVFKGEILGLFSWNSAEKELLVKALNGGSRIDRGMVYLYDAPVDAGKYQQMAASRVFVIDSKTKLCKNMTVAENIFLIRDHCRQYIINNKVILRQTEELFKIFGVRIDPKKDAGKLKPLERCVVELVKAFAIERKASKLIILNELSNYLNILELGQINDIAQAMKKAGNSIIYVDNDLDLLMHISERIMVMRDGKNARTFRKENFRRADIMAVFSGGNSPPAPAADPPSQTEAAEEILRFERVASKKIHDLSVTIRKGEILSFLDPHGRAEDDIVGLLDGSAVPKSGSIYFKGEAYDPRKTDLLKEGIGFIKEDAIEKSVFKRWSVLENLAFISINRYKGRFMSLRRFYKSISQEYYPKFGESIHANSLKKADMATMHKVLYYKWHLFTPSLLVCVRPFVGLDVAMRQLVIGMIREIADKGVAVAIVSSNVNEAYAFGSGVALLSESGARI